MEASHSQRSMIRVEERMEGMRGNVHLCIKRNGEVIHEEDDHNLIVTAGRAKLARLMGGGYAGHIARVGVGEGGSAVSESDTRLTNGVLVGIESVSYEGTSVRFNFCIGTGQANGLSIREFGLFFADGTMFSHRIRQSVIGKESDIEITGYWEIYL